VLRKLVLVAAASCGNNPSVNNDASVDTIPAICEEAKSHQDFTWIQQNILTNQCAAFSGCHNGATNPAGMVDLRAGMAHAHLVDYDSVLEPTRKLVVAGDPGKSYMLVMIGEIQPQNADPPAGPIRSDVGLMPQGSGLLCVEKRDAIQRWIMAGALDN
jgi:hypothetical protein